VLNESADIRRAPKPRVPSGPHGSRTRELRRPLVAAGVEGNGLGSFSGLESAVKKSGASSCDDPRRDGSRGPAAGVVADSSWIALILSESESRDPPKPRSPPSPESTDPPRASRGAEPRRPICETGMSDGIRESTFNCPTEPARETAPSPRPSPSDPGPEQDRRGWEKRADDGASSADFERSRHEGRFSRDGCDDNRRGCENSCEDG